jgi:hypothetical protein
MSSPDPPLPHLCPQASAKMQAGLKLMRRARKGNMADEGSTAPALASLSEGERRQAMDRFSVLRPHLEEGVPLSRAADHAGIAVRTAERWLRLFRRGGLAGLARPARRDTGKPRLPRRGPQCALASRPHAARHPYSRRGRKACPPLAHDRDRRPFPRDCRMHALSRRAVRAQHLPCLASRDLAQGRSRLADLRRPASCCAARIAAIASRMATDSECGRVVLIMIIRQEVRPCVTRRRMWWRTRCGPLVPQNNRGLQKRIR